ncbi:MAG: 1-acyl-sn-glycerol-3-phosphate acyltransferase [Proteobacteria bacterium]|nr:1-acyl-sn-glycerol-3-phosphate acyltransferase [Pseudomonadota bacterium]MCP4917492.1 1-acyl-sn-glycerol-3-phosphate acyltransferase [Pseudomonadota bacterium]
MDLDALSALDPAALRRLVPGFVNSYFRDDAAIATAAEARVREVVEQATDDELRETMAIFGSVGGEYRPYEAAPVLRRISRAYIPVPCGDARAEGLEHLESVRGRNQLWICNHLSYVDTQVTDALIAKGGCDIIDDVLVVAGPKVYTEPFRRLAAVALNTLMTAQSSQLQHNASGLSPREIASIAVTSMKQARTWRAERGPVLLYPEGSRSRSGRLGSFLRAAARYARGAEVIVPVAITGSENLFGYDERMRPAEVTLTIGEPFTPKPGKTAAIEEARERIAGLLPEAYKPDPATPVLR